MFDLSNYALNPHTVPIVIIGFASLGLGLLTYSSNKTAPANRHFLILCLSISVWLLATGAGLSSRNPALALRWFKLDNLGVMYISVAFYAFSVEFLEMRRPRSIRLGYAAASLLAAIILLTDRFVTGVQEYWWGYYPQWGSYSFPFFVVFFSYMAAAFKAYFQSYRKVQSPIKRNQITYVLLAFLVAYTGSVDFLPVFGYEVYPFGYIPIFVLVSVITYAILRYRLMDISLVINKGLAYSLLLCMIFIPSYLAIAVSHRATLYSIPPLLAGTLIFACGLGTVLKNPRATTNRLFGLLCLSLCFWLFGAFMVYSTTDETKAIFWWKFIYIGVVFIPAIFNQFCANFLQSERERKLTLINYFISTLFALLIPTSYLIDGQYSYFWGSYPRVGLLHPLFLVYFLGVNGLSLRKLYLGYRAQEGRSELEATRTKFVFLAFTIGYAAFIDFVQSYGIEFYPMGYLFVTLMAGILSFSILKYHVMDTTAIGARTHALPHSHALMLIPSYVVILMLIRLFTGSMQYLLAGILVVLFLIFSGILVHLQKIMEKAVEKVLFRKTHDAYETLSTFSKALVRMLDLKTLTEEIVRTLVKVMGIKTVTLYLLDKEKNIYAPASSYGLLGEDASERHFAASNPLPHHLEKMQAILVREELEHAPPRSRAHSLIATLHSMRADVCIPFINKNVLVGFCVLGPRTMHQMYSDQDLNLLTTLAQAAAIALDNAALYAELKRSQTLVRRADRLRSLEIIAGGFAHEIRNPLTSIKTFIQLTPERKDDPEFIGYFSTVVAEDVARIERLIQEILDYSRYMQPKFLEEDVNDVVASCLYFVRIKADAKSVLIQQDYAKGLPPVTLDRQQIKQVLLNLLLNAIDAMNGDGGRLIVKTHRLAKAPDDSWVQIEIGDTGCGIASADLDHIFDPFYTTKHASEEREGTGLGLTIAHQIVQEHGGHITVESQLGKGTTFSISLPVKPVAVAYVSKDEEL